MVLGGIWFSAPRPTANRSSVLPDETEDRKLFFRFWEYIHGLTKVAQLWLFFRVQIRAHFSENLDHACIVVCTIFFFSLYPTLCISLIIISLLCRLLTQTAGKYFFLKFQAFTGTFQTLKTQTEIQAFSRISSTVTNPVLSGTVWTAQIVVSQIRHSNVNTTPSKLTW